MWEQYKKTATGMQLVIGLVSAVVLLWSHVLALAALFFVTMQIASVLGAVWAVRLKGKTSRA